jgi:predicted nucleic-acid-binding protein
LIALDTNILVRAVTADDPPQTALAEEFLRRAESLWIPKTVLLELVWVLGYTYKLDRGALLRALIGLLSFRKMVIEDREAVLRALVGFEAGLDFADALHLASSAGAERFATFDRPLAKAADQLPGSPTIELLGSA